MNTNNDVSAKAIVTTTTTENGKQAVKEEVIEGTEEEVEKQLDSYKSDLKQRAVEEKKIIKKVNTSKS